MKITKYAFFLLLITQTSFGQISEPIPKSYTKMDGLEYVGNITFYFEKETQTILAYQTGKIKWKANVIKVCGKPSVGKSKIRQIRMFRKDSIEGITIVYGKHSFAKIEMETGKVTCEGQD